MQTQPVPPPHCPCRGTPARGDTAPPPRHRARRPQPGGATRRRFLPRDELHPRDGAFPARGEKQEPRGRRGSPVLTAHGGAGRAAAAAAASGAAGTRQAPSAAAPFRFLPRAAAAAPARGLGSTAPRLQLPSCSAASENNDTDASHRVRSLPGVVVLRLPPS